MKARAPADLLLRCLSDRGQRSAVSREPTTDWKEVVDIAAREHVAPLLFKRLKENDARAQVPADVWQRLRFAYFASGDRNTRLNRELGAVLRSLRDAGIKVIVLKGAYLAEAIYGDVALRPMCDSDLMVPQSDLARAGKVLLDMGGVPLKKRLSATPDDEARADGFGKANHAVPVLIRDLAVEIHWTIVAPNGPVRVEFANLWDRARPAVIAGEDVLALSSEDLLLHLCLHLCYHHGCVGLRYLCDVAETVRRFRAELDWPQVVDLARAAGADKYVELALRLAETMLDAEVPGDVLERLVPGGLDPRAFETAKQTVVTGKPYDRWLSPAFLGLRSREPAAARVKRVWERTFLSRDALLAEYPAARESRHPWVFHARRLRDITRKWVPALFRMPGRDWKRNLSGSALLADWLKSGRED